MPRGSSSLHIAASLGGHIEVLTALEPAFADLERTWVTSEGSRAEALRTAGQRVSTLPRLDRRNLSLGRLVAGPLLALRERPETVLTSGAGVVLGFCLTARLLGARVLFVETMARVHEPSLTGRVLRHVADATFVQWPELAGRYPGATVCAPALLEGVGALGTAGGTGTFVSMGNHDRAFARLSGLVDDAVRAGVLPSPVLAQSGASDFAADEVRAVATLSPAAFAEAVAAHAVVVCHAGAGVVATVLRAGKRPLVLARRVAHDEHVDDHQEQLVDKLGELGLVVPLDGALTTADVDAAAAPQDAAAAFAGLPRLQEAVAAALAPARPRPRVVAVAWGAHTARSAELAAAVGGVSRRYGNAGLTGRGTAPLRWLVNAVRTAAFLRRARPEVVIAQNPPVLLALLGAAYTRRRGRRLVLDSHPASFGRKGDTRWRLLLPLHRVVARRAALTLVTADELREEVEGWGGRAALVHEAPPEAHGTAPAPGAASKTRRPRVLFVGVFAPDEPVDAVVEAARSLPRVDVRVTGDPSRAPAGLASSAPANVELVGYLGPEDYRAALADADVVLALTTERTSVIRAAYEAVYAERPLVVSDWPTLRTLFPYAIPTGHEPAELAAALEAAIDDLDELRRAAPAARELQVTRWAGQLATLRAAVGA